MFKVNYRRHFSPAKYVSFGITAACFYAIAGILGCGGGGSIPNSGMENPCVGICDMQTAYDYRDFAPYRQSVIRTFNHGTYNANVISPGEIDVHWGDSIEEHRIRGEWVYLDAYRTGKYRWESIATRSEINYGQGWVDVTPKDGYSLYGPVIVPKDGFVLRQWGCIENDARYQPAGCDKKWFHQHRITYAGLVHNPCWQGIGDSLRPALKQEEVWWDSDIGWFRGTGVLKDGLPTGEVTYGFFQMIAKDAGYVWQGSDGVCLIR